ncbi:hypothetical protein MMUR_48590 [Mycolicibacterium murale]|jgi:hypothetical protein|uniref:DUF4149 domain-containing protein n=1 Tax=Mycolicibacterium murale TaxID=182220 RepID=A0A7I9WSZ4_9MYCO|nr:hypothetical protein [Mycolicibacterium murale]MCV7186478.1 hypothetical protein [Mycolicibacterium murale]GFG60723.1 hypothetical protein MMUR_48590 [Mycolicibacterium murale]
MGIGWSVAVATVFVWLGMVLAISFLEAPLKFRAPGVTPALGLGIGRLVFRALNVCEAALALAALVGVWWGAQPDATAAVMVAAVILAVQIAVVRPVLTRRSNEVLAGRDAPRSRAHLGYVVLEVVKVIALLSAGTLLLVH